MLAIVDTEGKPVLRATSPEGHVILLELAENMIDLLASEILIHRKYRNSDAA
jgi:hypothetical protein